MSPAGRRLRGVRWFVLGVVAAAAAAVPWGASGSAAGAASWAQSPGLASPESVCAHAGAARHARPARAAGRLAARITDTSGMWLAADCVVHVLGGTTSSGEPWVFTAMVMPHLGANGGPALCLGLWVGRRADGHGVTCGQPPLGTPDAVDFRASAVPMAQGVRFAVATVPPGVQRVDIVLDGGKHVRLETTGAKLGVARLFAVGVLPANRSVQGIVVSDRRGRHVGRTRGVMQSTFRFPPGFDLVPAAPNLIFRAAVGPADQEVATVTTTGFGNGGDETRGQAG